MAEEKTENHLRSIQQPNLKVLLDSYKQDTFNEINCHTIGIIQEFDVLTQRAIIKINFKHKVLDTIKEYPLLIDCPVVILSGGNASLRMPITEGDTALVLFNDRDIDNWAESGQIAVPNSERTHSLSDAIVLVGIRSLQNVITDYDSDYAGVVNGTTKVLLKDKVKFENNVRNLKILIDSLINTIKAITTTGADTISTVSQAQLEAVKVTFGELLE